MNGSSQAVTHFRNHQTKVSMVTSISKISEIDTAKECVLAYGHFTTIHAGHIRYLKHAKSLGKHLVVGLIGETENARYPFSQNERAEALELLGIADSIVLLKHDELDEIIRKLEPSIVVLGSEYKDNKEISKTLQEQITQGRSVQFHAGETHYATADLLSGSERDLRQQRQLEFRAACNRQNISKATLLKVLEGFSKARLIVLGDTIVDQYAACEAIGMSAEAPVVVVRELEKRNFVGGAGVVAAHVCALGAKCDLVSVVGNDDTALLVNEELKNKKIGNALCIDTSRPTTFKKRYIVENQKLFRVSRLEDHNLDSEIEDKVIEELNRLAPKAGAIIVSDFVYGVITDRVLSHVKELARKYHLLLFGDLQCSSQVGSVTKFTGFSLLSPNEREARLALKDKESGLEQLSQKLLKVTGSERLVMKLGSEGFIAYDRLKSGELTSQPFPALSVNPLDVAGAGDSLLALFATGLTSGCAMMPTAALASCMAALAVETMGNTPISANSLRNSLEEIF